MKRIFLIFLCFVLLLSSLCACSPKEPSPQTTVPEETTAEEEQTTAQNVERNVVLGYYAASSLNPFKTKSRANISLDALLFDSLFTVDEKYDAIGSIASSIEIEEKKVTVSLKSGLTFSDGSELGASDVAYSFTLAKSSPFFSYRLSNVASCTDSADKVIFTLFVEDAFVASCLDFPVVKRGTGGQNVPVGSGRYVLKKSKGEYFLSASQSGSSEEIMEQKTIKLLDLAGTKNELHLLRTGELTSAFDLENSSKTSKTDAGVSKFPLNNLVFLSFNKDSEYFSDSRLRKVVSLVVDKEEVSSTIYDSAAKPATAVFNPDWSVCSALESTVQKTDFDEASKILDDCGFVYAYSNNKYRSKDFEFFKVTMLVNKEDSRRVKAAKLIRSKLEKCGINVVLSSLSFDEYEKALSGGDFDLYLGEIKLSANMDLSPFFSSAGKANFGIDTSSSLADAYFDFKKGKIDLSTFVRVFDEELSFLPLCYREGTMYYSRALKFEGSPCENDIYSNIYSWSF